MKDRLARILGNCYSDYGASSDNSINTSDQNAQQDHNVYNQENNVNDDNYNARQANTY